MWTAESRANRSSAAALPAMTLLAVSEGAASHASSFAPGASGSVARWLRVGAEARFSRGGIAGDAHQLTGSLGIGPIGAPRLAVRTRSTSYTTDRTAGWLHALTIGADPLGPLHLELDGGLRTQHVTQPPATTTGIAPVNALSDGSWFGASVDINLGRSWYLLISGSRDNVGLDPTNLVYSSLVYRF